MGAEILNASGENDGERTEKRRTTAILETIKEKLEQTLPSLTSVDINDLKARGLASWLAALHLTLYLAIGLALFVTGYQSEKNQKYLSLNDQGPSAKCNNVPVAITGTFYADAGGVWSTNEAFDPARSIFQLSMTGTRITNQTFKATMEKFAAQLRAHHENASNLDVIGQQIALSLFRATDKEASMKLETNAQLGQIFSKLSARNAWSSFYSSKDQISLGIGSFGIRQRFSLNIDVASSVTAYAINFGIIDTDRLTKVLSSSGHDDEGPLEINGWVDDNHPGMDTVYCFSGKLRRVCVPKYGRYSYAFPVIATMKVNRTNRHYNLETCECSRDKWSSGMFGCNIGTSFILALLFSNDQYEESAIQKGTHKMFNNMVNFKNLVMNLLLNEDYQMIGEKIGPGVSIFMTVLDYPGSIASINPQGVKVTQFAAPSLPKFNITNFSGSNTSYPFVMCQNLFVHPAALEQMANNPPVTMEQPYFECTPTNATAFFTAAGIATANSATVSAIFLGLAVTLAIHYFNRSHKDAKILPPAEKALLAEQLSQHLLVENNLLHSRLDEMTANMIALSSELASIKTALPKKQHNNSTESPQLATLSFARPLSTLARPSTDEIPDSAYCDNPLHSQKAAKKFDPIVQELHGRL